MSWITTFTGKHFDPVSPDERLIDITDIAHALCMICRANGHTKFFYSVGQHSIACARESMQRGWSREISLGCLLHDASEAYLSDVTRPVKKDLTRYLEVERRLQDMIWEKYLGRPLTEKERTCIFEIDDEMLSLEFHQLMPEDLNEDYRKLVRAHVCRYAPQEEAARGFTALFEELRSS